MGIAFQEFDSQKGSLDVPVSHPLQFFIAQNKKRLDAENAVTKWKQVKPAEVNLNT